MRIITIELCGATTARMREKTRAAAAAPITITLWHRLLLIGVLAAFIGLVIAPKTDKKEKTGTLSLVWKLRGEGEK